MSNFLVSARKYRPDVFDSVVGQPSVTHTLKSAIHSGQVAHAYLFCGPRGVGKTTCARIFAKTLNCFNRTAETEACDNCESCLAVRESRSFNIHELDAASNNSIEDIRMLIEKVRILPQVGKYSIYIIDEVHMLSQSAFNAFLKTLEEPPPHAIFILATTEKHKIIPTILSRCQIFDFHRIKVSDIGQYLKKVADNEHITTEDEALNIIALKADGSMRDALSIFDQVASFSNRNITYKEVIENLNILDYEYYFRLTDFLLQHDVPQCLLLFDEVLNFGFDGLNFISGFSTHLRDLLVCRDPNTARLLEVSDSLGERYRSQASATPADFIVEALEICNQCELGFKVARNQRLHIEITLIRLASLQTEKKKRTDASLKLAVPPIPQATLVSKPPAVSPKDDPAAGRPVDLPKPHSKPIVPAQANISISQALRKMGQSQVNEPDENAMQQQETEVGEPSGELHADEILGLLALFAESIRTDRPRWAGALRGIKIQITGPSTLQIGLSNKAQLDDFNRTLASDMQQYLTGKLKIRLKIEAILQDADEKTYTRLYTPEDKFQYLNNKNSELSRLKQMLNLELE